MSFICAISARYPTKITIRISPSSREIPMPEEITRRSSFTSTVGSTINSPTASASANTAR